MQQCPLWIALMVAMSGVAHAQDPGAPSFETASVKPVPAMSRGPVDFRLQPGGRLTITNLPLIVIIREAFGMKRYQISGGPAWLNSDSFDIAAKAEGDPSRPEMMAMLRNLLADRFQLRVRMETKETSVYAMTVAKGGPKLSPSTAESAFIRQERNTPVDQAGVDYTLVARKASLAMFAERLGEVLGRPVLDKTGLQGEFDFKVRYATDINAAEGASIFTAVREQLGLRLESTKGPVQALVIIGAEQPSAN